MLIHIAANFHFEREEAENTDGAVERGTCSPLLRLALATCQDFDSYRRKFSSANFEREEADF
tara:strand:- start:106 stop:291 length:186 start_codon:yes stop_codon:yes gene_type:complete